MRACACGKGVRAHALMWCHARAGGGEAHPVVVHWVVPVAARRVVSRALASRPGRLRRRARAGGDVRRESSRLRRRGCRAMGSARGWSADARVQTLGIGCVTPLALPPPGAPVWRQWSSSIAHAFVDGRIVSQLELGARRGGPSGSGELQQLWPEVSPGSVGHSAAAAAVPVARQPRTGPGPYILGRLNFSLSQRGGFRQE